MLAGLAMLARRQGALRVAAGGSDWSALRGPIPFPALRAAAWALLGRDGKAGSPVEPEGWICEFGRPDERVVLGIEGDDANLCPVAGWPTPALRITLPCVLVDRVASGEHGAS